MQQIILLFPILTVISYGFIHLTTFKKRIIDAPLRLGPTNPLVAIHESGLLSKVPDIKSSYFYSNDMEISFASELLHSKNIYATALANANGNVTGFKNRTKEILNTAKSFMKKDALWNRDELKGTLQRIIDDSGNFVCLLGGKNTGKSLVLKNIESSNRHKVFIVNLRDQPDILAGLVETLQHRISALNPNTDKVSLKVLQNIVIDVAEGFIESMAPSSIKNLKFTDYVKIILTKREPSTLQALIKKLVEKMGDITLIVDEANIALTVDERTSAIDIKATQAALAFFTKMTKETQQLNVILTSSEHAFPFGLTKLGFNLANFNEYVYAGEVPPRDMYALLTKEWKIEENLSICLMSHYGGHIWDTYQALGRLGRMGEDFIALDDSLTSNVIACLDWKGTEPEDKQRMIYTLRLLAEQGFAPIQDITNRVAEVISKNNVGGVVRSRSTIIELPRSVWKQTECKFGIVPTQQSMRLAIAEQLVLLQNKESV